MDFDPLDNGWWRAGAWLNWWDSSRDNSDIGWVPDAGRARAYVTRHRRVALSALGLAWSYRTVETGQMHALDPRLPADGGAMLWRSLFALSLLDVGLPVMVGSRMSTTPGAAGFTAVRLPAYVKDIRPTLEELGYNPVEIASVGGMGSLRGRRQYDRHNLVTAQLAVAARRRGWMTCGEAWGSFAMLTGDPLRGQGGPDLQMVGPSMRVCVETTASGHMELAGKTEQWKRMLALDSCADVHVVWLECSRVNLLNQIEGHIADSPRMHAARAADFLKNFVCTDGWSPEPGDGVEPRDWMEPVMADIGARLGLPAAGSFRRPSALKGLWLG